MQMKQQEMLKKKTVELVNEHLEMCALRVQIIYWREKVNLYIWFSGSARVLHSGVNLVCEIMKSVKCE